MPVKRLVWNWDDAKAITAAQEGSDEGIKAASDLVLSATNQVVPLESGELMGSGQVDFDMSDHVGFVSYDTIYAKRLHVHKEYNFQGGRRGSYLKDTMTRSKTQVLEYFGKALKVRFSKR